MEIEVLGLDDIIFELDCHYCDADGTRDRGYVELPRAKGQRQKYGPPDPPREKCGWCHGTKMRLTPVGERLIEFLTKRGIALTP